MGLLGLYLICCGIWLGFALFGLFILSVTENNNRDEYRHICRSILATPIWPVIFLWLVVSGFIWIVKTAFGKD